MAAPLGNKFAVGNTGGRPPKFDSKEALEAKISAFFDSCKEDGVKGTITGLALYLGFCSRSSLDDYAEKGEEYSYTIKRAKLAVENSYELSASTFDIFALKNMGWKDRQEIAPVDPDGNALQPSININVINQGPSLSNTEAEVEGKSTGTGMGESDNKQLPNRE